jgi:DNA-binding NarL/FixJ family response regulator
MPRTKSLSPRLQQVWQHIAYGYSNPEIAKLLGITEATVKQYVSDLLDQFEVANRVQLALEYHKIDWRA